MMNMIRFLCFLMRVMGKIESKMPYLERSFFVLAIIALNIFSS